MTIQSGVFTEITGVFKDVVNKETYSSKQELFLPQTKHEKSNLHLHCMMSTEAVEDNLRITIELIAPNSLVKNSNVLYVDLVDSPWFEHEDKTQQQLLESAAHAKLPLLKNILNYCEDTITDFSQYINFLDNFVNESFD